MRAAWLLVLAACTPAASRPPDRKATIVTPTPPPVPSRAATAPASTEGFSDAAVTSVRLASGRLVITYASAQGKLAELSVAALPSGLTWNRHALTVSQEVDRRPDGPRTLTTVMDASGPVLVLGENVGLGQRLPGGFACAPGKLLGPSTEPRRQAVEVVLHDRSERALATTAPGKLVRFGAAPEVWQLVVTRATVGGSEDEGPPLSVDLVLVKQ
jgi:hypothetical protein